MTGRRGNLAHWWSGYVKARDSRRLAHHQSLLRPLMRLATRISLWLHAGVFLLLLIGVTAAVCAQGLPAAGAPGAVNDLRYCGEPARRADGRIKRSRTVLREFAKVFPCPATLLPLPICQGWAIDHVIPLADGGCDAAVNLQWLPDRIKSCADADCKDRWERLYHAQPRQAVGVLP